MSRTEEDCLFLEEDAKWLPLDASLLAVRECLHKLIGGVREAIPYFKGETSNAPAEELSRRFAAIYTHGSTAFEDMCDRLKMFGPSEIPDSKAQPILRLGRILASAVEELLTIAEVSDLRDAMESLSNLACNTPKSCPADVYANRVEGTRESIHRGFRSLTDGFRKLEHQMREGSTKTSSLVDEIRTSTSTIAEAIRSAKTEIVDHTESVEEAVHSEASGIRHEVERLRKGGKATKRWSEKEQREAAEVWMRNKHNSFVRQQMNHDGRIQKVDVFVHCKKDMQRLRIETPEEFEQILEQNRKRNPKTENGNGKRKNRSEAQTSKTENGALSA